MGSLQAAEMAASLPLDTALRWHLEHNHFPPIGWLFAAAKAAIEAARAGELDAPVFLGDNAPTCRRHGASCPAWHIIQIAHLEPFCEPEEND